MPNVSLIYVDDLFCCLRWLVKNLGIAIVLPIGRSYVFPFFPKRIKLIHCVGKPIPVKRSIKCRWHF